MTRNQAALTLHIDWSKCDGRGLCAELLHERIRRDEWGYPVVRGGNDDPVPAPLTSAAVKAVRACPLAALHLVRMTRDGAPHGRRA
ncbi:ferredoxin [Pseudoclavibacter caeni]|uniref:Ferredoxin n=1 Tax=Pseudoclavibacter caeni TaxID=908846 RepID=A0A7C8BSR7_9MICO|nr:ferredoxin [Pseudoclavibacter caeni]KAB1633386.1 ferredoxin [Pseudoclavibacter caeni]NYJ96634.1 ferredoxin [Pseudoclavibacter caeni]